MDNIVDKLKKDVYEVDFIKKDGSIRKMICTLQPHMLPETNGTKRKLPENLVTVFDLENEGWRSFYTDKVIKMEKFKWTQ